MRKFIIISPVFIFICLFFISCSQRDAPSPVISATNEIYVSKVRAGDFSPGQLEAHYLKHGYQFDNITQEQYLESARALLNAKPGKDVLLKKRSNGDILRYKVSTGEFAVMTSEGRIRSYFKTDYRYWMRQ